VGALARALSLPVATRTVLGHLADRADCHGRVRTTAGELADCCCLPVTRVADALVDLASYRLLAQDGRILVLTDPGGQQ
jgi:hypothetical protein